MKEKIGLELEAGKDKGAEQFSLLEKEEKLLKAVEEAVGLAMADHKFFAPYRILPVSGTGAKKETKPIDFGVVLEVWGKLPAEEKENNGPDSYFQYLVCNIFKRHGYEISESLEKIQKASRPPARTKGAERLTLIKPSRRKDISKEDIERERRRKGFYAVPAGDIESDLE